MLIPPEEVQHRILKRSQPLQPEVIALAEARGRFLAESVQSADPLPPFDNSAMDGFALRFDDCSEGMTLSISQVIEAGSQPRALDAGTAARIYTGAPIPEGADVVLPFEQAGSYDDHQVQLATVPPRQAHIRFTGGDVKPGTLLLRPGEVLSPAAIGLLASVGATEVAVGRRPRVAVHSSGNELVPIDAPLTPGKIRNSNAYSLVARVQDWGAEPLHRPVLLDTMDAVRVGLRKTLSLRPDVIVTTGGISAGDLDFIREVAKELGDDVEVLKVAMKPGKPFVFGHLGGALFFGLPGNPAACLVSFEMFVRPALARLEGRPDGHPTRVQARVRDDLQLTQTPRLQLVRATLEYDNDVGEFVVAAVGGQGSHQLSSFAHANALLRVEPHCATVMAGEMLPAMLLQASF